MRLESERLSSLHRAFALVQDRAIALTAGLDDYHWLSRIMQRFTVTKSVAPGEYPTRIDDLDLRYCGLIVLHLADPTGALVEAQFTIERCHPVLLVACSDTTHEDRPGRILEPLGAREYYRAGPDRIYGWAR